jgi:NAD(P)-dependent dehydrogenase (short-subunit alcohol dehydrogenase family)
MRLIENDEDDGAFPEPRRSALSRRSLLQVSAIGASVGFAAGWSSLAMAGEAEWTAADIPAQAGRKVLLTGGNGYPEDGRSGLGYHGALAFAQSGADVTIASRDRARGEEAVRQILAQVPGANVRFEALNLADLASVRVFTTKMRASGQGLDLLVNNAGVMGRFDREVSVDGFERVFATNTLGHFVLAAELLPILKKGREPRIVWVSSLRASAGKLDLDELPLPRAYDYAAAYDNSKLANLMLALEFDRRSKAFGWGISSVASHPGVARTNLIPDGPGFNSREGRRFTMLPFMFRDPAQGVLPILYAATTTVAEPGGYYGPAGFQELRGAPGIASVPSIARDPRSSAALWASLEQLGQLSTGYWQKG